MSILLRHGHNFISALFRSSSSSSSCLSDAFLIFLALTMVVFRFFSVCSVLACVCDIPWLATTRCWIRTSAASLSRRQCLSCQSRWCSPDLSGTDDANGLVGLTLDFPASQRVLCSPLCDTPWLQPASTRCWIQTPNASSASTACIGVSVMHSFLALTNGGLVLWIFSWPFQHYGGPLTCFLAACSELACTVIFPDKECFTVLTIES